MELSVKYKIAIMGAGAIGSVIGGMLSRQGYKVKLVGRRPHIDEIRKNGLHISGIWGNYTIRDINAVTVPPHEFQDIVILTVKSFDTAIAATEAMPMVGADTVVVSIQNGLGNIETLTKVFGTEKIIGGMAIFGAILTKPGNVGVTVIASETLVGELDWQKALYNVALNPLSAIFQVSYGQIADNPDTRWLAEQMITEAFQVANASGQSLGVNTAEEYLDILWNQKLPPTRDHKSSMLQDILGGKKTEIDYINGAIIRLGAEYGIETPYNSAVIKMVKAKESLGHW
jgi:2-dehydropantoate 2-reductase